MDGLSLPSEYSGIERRHTVLPYFGEERRSSVRGLHALDDEALLLRRAAMGDREAFARLYDRFVDQVFRYIYYSVGHRAVAEQLTARVFMNAWRELEQHGRDKLPFTTWLYRLAHDAIAVHRDIPIKPAPQGGGLEVSRLSLQKEPASALAQLAHDQREVLILRFLVGYSTEQVAQILGKQPAAIRTLQHRGLDGLGAILRKGAEK